MTEQLPNTALQITCIAIVDEISTFPGDLCLLFLKAELFDRIISSGGIVLYHNAWMCEKNSSISSLNYFFNSGTFHPMNL